MIRVIREGKTIGTIEQVHTGHRWTYRSIGDHKTAVAALGSITDSLEGLAFRADPIYFQGKLVAQIADPEWMDA